jgi:hypothetical protein
MNYQAFTNDSLTMMYEGIRGALAADDALARQGTEIRFRIRVTPDWKKHAGELESEMLNREMFFDVIDWSEEMTAGSGSRPTCWRAGWDWGHLGLSAGWGQSFALVEIQSCASASVAKFPT